MAIPVIGTIASGLFGLAGDWLKGKREKQQAKQEKEIEIIRKSATWDEIMAEGSKSSFKDEFWTIVLAIPAVMAFIPSMDQYVIAGFESLADTPEWYQLLLTLAVAAAFGYRKVVQMVSELKGKKGR